MFANITTLNQGSTAHAQSLRNADAPFTETTPPVESRQAVNASVSRGRHGGGRRRGNGAGRGRRSTQNNYKYEDPSQDWNMHKPVCNLIVEDDFTKDIISCHALRFCSSAMTRLKTELQAASIKKNDAGIVVLLLTDLLEMLLKNVNGYIALNDPGC